MSLRFFPKNRKPGYTKRVASAARLRAFSAVRAMGYRPPRTGRSIISRSLNGGNRPHSFTAQYQDFNLALFSGQSGGFQVYASGSTPGSGVPLAPTCTAATFEITANFSLLSLNIQPYTTAAAPGALAQLALTNYTEYTNLFDEYILDKIEMIWYFNSNNSSMNSPHVSAPLISVVHDFDDASFTSLPSMQQYDSYRVMQFGNSSGPSDGRQVVTIKPKFQAVVETVAGTAVGLPFKGWLDTITPTAEHFGLKFFYLNTEVGTAGAPVYIGDFQIATKLFFRCRGTK